MTPTELNQALDELGGRLLSNRGPETRADAKRLVDALRQLRSEHTALGVTVELQDIAFKGRKAELDQLRARCIELEAKLNGANES